MDRVVVPGVRVVFRDWACHVALHRFANNGNLRVCLEDAADGFPVANVSINPAGGVSLPDHRVLVKDYSENEGIVPALQAAGVIGDGPLYPLAQGNVYELLLRPPEGLVSREAVLRRQQ